jgi:hypothetical protein
VGLQKKVVAGGAAALLCTALTGVAQAADPPSPAAVGAWSAPFVEPPSTADPSTWCRDDGTDSEHAGKNVTCTPTAGSMAILGGNDVVYWDALEDMEEVETTVATEFGSVSVNDQTRRLRLGSPNEWFTPAHPDGNDGSDDASASPHPLTPSSSTDPYNDAALFCAALTFLPDGTILAAGGTTYYNDPSVPQTKYGVAELEGMANTRIYDPRSNSWSAAGKMAKGRWYPTVVPLADGKVFVASGVTKLIKPVYPDEPPTESGRNVVVTETYTPSGRAWHDNGRAADRSLPLFPRLHLLPDGRVFFNAAGQVFNPMGYAYDELTWNRTAFYDPSQKSWSDGDIPGLGTPAPGFRGSTFSVMLPLTLEDGVYKKAQFLTAGGIIGTTPGTYFAVTDSRIDTVTNGSTAVTSESTGSLNQARWYGTGVLTPTGEVIAFSGASADEVDGPGTAIPVTSPELFDPKTKTWTTLAPATEKRTYHNTAALLPDGRILVGGHAPIGTLYGPPKTLVPGVTSPQETRNPTFEIYSPPYLFRGDRPVIKNAAKVASPAQDVEITLDGAASDIESVMLMRRTAITLLVDGGQRGVELPIVSRSGNTLKVRMPPSSTVVPAGPYLLFVSRSTPSGPTPSIAWGVDVRQGPVPTNAQTAGSDVTWSAPARDLAAAGAVPVNADLAFHEIAHSHLPAPGSPGGQDIPWPVWPVLAAVTVTGFWTLRHRTRGKASTNRIS